MFPAPATAIDGTERRRLSWIIVLHLLAITLPYLWAVLITPPGFEYGGLLFNPDDQNVHLAWARQATQGHFFFRDLFTTEGLSDGKPALFNNIFCWAMGILSVLSRLPLIWVYHGLRLLFAALLLRWFYALCALLTPDKRVRLIATILVAFSAGFGWLRDVPFVPQVVRERVFIDRPDAPFPMMPEAFSLTSTLIFPLFAVSIALLPLIFGLMLRAQQSGRPRDAVMAAGAALVLGNIHTYDALPLMTTMTIWAALGILKKNGHDSPSNSRAVWLPPLMVVAGALLPVLYQVAVFRLSPEFGIKASTPTPSPPLGDVLLSYGPLMLLAIVGLAMTWREPRHRLMIVWIVVVLAAIYAPISFARKMIEGVHLPLCFLAACGLVWLIQRVRAPQMRRLAVAATVAVLSISSVQFVGWCLVNAQDNNNSGRGGPFIPPLYLSQGDAAALRFLTDLPPASRRRAVLCLPKLGNYGPRVSGLHVYIGHWAETLYRGRKLEETALFYAGQIPRDAALWWLRENHVGYVVEGQFEKQWMQAQGVSSPSQRLGLQQVFKQANTTVYAVPSANSPRSSAVPR